MNSEILLPAGSGSVGRKNPLQAPPLKADNIKRLSAAGSIDVTSAGHVTFDSDAADGQLNLGSTADASDYYVLLGGDSFGIAPDVTAIYVNQACGYILS